MDIRYTVELFGGFAVRSADGVVLTRFRSRQTASLLAYLAYHPARPHSREVLADMFWPSAPTSENARLSLSVALSNLRGQLEKPPLPPEAVFVATNATLAIRSGAIETDVQRFENLLAEERWEEAVDAYTGPLLPGFYDEWVTAEQARLRDRFHYTVVQLRRRCEKQGDIEGALRWHRLTVHGDPTDRDAVSALLTALAKAGRHEEVARTFYEIERRLRDEYDEAISPRLRAEHADLLARFPSPHAKRGRGRPRLGGRGPEPGAKNEEAQAVRADFPAPLEAPPRAPTTGRPLPLQLRPIIGRESVVAELETRFLAADSDRLVTLTGMTGIGKTQLAIALAHRLQRRGKRVLFVPLLTLRREDQALSDVAEAVGAQGTDTDSLMAATAQALEAEPTVLILDNFEHLLNTKAPLLVGQLLARSPSLKCLVTSQKRLPIPGETAYPVPPLAVPLETDMTWESANSDEILTRYPAMALFEERAKNVLPDFALSSFNRRAVGDLVRALNGVPLAIELAAARVNILAPDEILAALTERISLLASTRIDPEDRHHSLQASLQWSYDLLPAPVQQLFRRIAVFRGGFAAADVAEVADEQLAFDYLALLSDASLLHSSYTPYGVRLSLLDIVRLFAEELMSNAEKAAARHRHAVLFGEKIEQARSRWRTAEEAAWLARLSADQDNLTAACHWLLGQQAPAHLELAYRMGKALNHYWMLRGQRAEGMDFLRTLLQKPVADPASPYGLAVPIDLRVSTLNALGVLFQLQGQLTEANHWVQRARETVEGAVPHAPDSDLLSLERQLAGIQMNLALIAQKQDNYRGARQLLENILQYYRRIGDTRMAAITLTNLGSFALDEGDLDASLRYLKEGKALAQECGDHSTVGNAFGNEGEIYLLRGDAAGAEAAWRAAVEIHHGLHANDHVSFFLLRLTVALERLSSRANASLVRSLRTTSCVYRQVASLPLDDFRKPPYNLTLPAPPRPLPSPATAEARLQEAVESLLHPRSRAAGSGFSHPVSDYAAPFMSSAG